MSDVRNKLEEIKSYASSICEDKGYGFAILVFYKNPPFVEWSYDSNYHKSVTKDLLETVVSDMNNDKIK